MTVFFARGEFGCVFAVGGLVAGGSAAYFMAAGCNAAIMVYRLKSSTFEGEDGIQSVDEHGSDVPPMATIPINDNNSGTQSIDVADSGCKRGYVQNWNASLGRQIARGLVLDVRYVGNKGTKLTRAPMSTK